MSTVRRLGRFFIIIGIVFLALFFISDYIEQVEGWYLLLGVASLGLGFWLASRSRSKPEPPRRFRLLRRLMGKNVPQEADETEEMDG